MWKACARRCRSHGYRTGAWGWSGFGGLFDVGRWPGPGFVLLRVVAPEDCPRIQLAGAGEAWEGYSRSYRGRWRYMKTLEAVDDA